MPLPQADALAIGPPSLELDLSMNGSNSTTIYFNSDGVTGELVIGKEDLPFRIEPSSVNMSKDDHYRPVELTFYGNETLEPGLYEGMVTFVAQTGGFVAVGIKIRAKINLLGEAQVREEEEEPETPDEEEEPDEDEPELESESETESEEDEEIESDEESDNDDDDTGNLYLIGGLTLGAILALGLIRIWWKRR